MASATPNMNLVTWESLDDFFSHTDLRNNFLAVDTHDHTPGKGVQIPSGAIANLAVTTSALADGNVTTSKIADINVTTGKVANNAITIAKLGSDVTTDYGAAFSNYKVMKEASHRFDAPVAGTFVLGNGSTGTGVAASGATAGLSVFYIDPADFTAGTRTTKYRVRAGCLTNATAPTINYTVGLYPVTAVAGGAATVSITLGAVTAGSTVAFNAQGASTPAQGNSGDFTAPVAGYYALATVVSGTAAANSAAAVRARLQMRQV